MKLYKKCLIMILTGIILIAMNMTKAKADTTFSWTSKESRIFYDNGGTESVYNWHTIPYTHSANYPITQMEYRLKYSGGLSAGNTYTFAVSYTPDPDAIYPTGLWFSDGTNLETIVNCSGWSRNSSGKYSNTCNLTPVADISSSGYLYVRIVYQEAYLTTLKSEIGNFTITKGTGAIIQDSAVDIMGNNNDNTNTLIENANDNATDIMNNANTNTTNIINNQNTNAQNIINNQNANTQAQIDANKVCTTTGTNDIEIQKKYLDPNGNELNANTTGISKYFTIDNKTELYLEDASWSSAYACFYNSNKVKISCFIQSNTATTGQITIPTNAKYFRYTSYLENGHPIYKICKQGSQAMQDTLNQDHTYNNNASENIQGQTDLDNLEDAEQDILDSLDFSGATNLDITINGQASSWIWAIVDRLRGMSEKIVLLFTSVLGMGIIKLVLNR